MTLEQLAKSGTEHAHQTALFAWCALSVGKHPELKWFHAIPNGGSRGDTQRSQQINGGMMKAEGVKKGVADCFLPVKRGIWAGLYIEMKKPDLKPKRLDSKGGLSDEQIAFGEFVKSQGFGWIVCYSWIEAKEILEKYLTT